MQTLSGDQVFQARVNSRNFGFIVTSQVRLDREHRGRGGVQNRKKCPDFENAVLTIGEKNSKIFPCEAFFSCAFLRHVYQRAMKPHLPWKISGCVPAWVNDKNPFTKQEKCDSLVLSRSHIWIIWRCQGIPCVH